MKSALLLTFLLSIAQQRCDFSVLRLNLECPLEHINGLIPFSQGRERGPLAEISLHPVGLELDSLLGILDCLDLLPELNERGRAVATAKNTRKLKVLLSKSTVGTAGGRSPVQNTVLGIDLDRFVVRRNGLDKVTGAEELIPLLLEHLGV